MPPAQAPQRPLRGIALKLGSVLVFIVMSALIKATADTVPPGEAVFFRAFFAMPVILIWLALRRELATGLRTARDNAKKKLGTPGPTIRAGRLPGAKSRAKR